MLLIRMVKSISLCGSLNKNDPYRPIESGAVRRCGLVGLDAALLEEAHHYEVGLRSQELQPGPVVLLLYC